MPLNAAIASREIIIGLHDLMAKRSSPQGKLDHVVDLIAEAQLQTEQLAGALRRAVIDGDVESRG